MVIEMEKKKLTPDDLDAMYRGYYAKWHSMASFFLGCVTGFICAVVVVAIWALVYHHG